MLKGNLRPVQLSDAEMILSWRNQDNVRVNMYNHEIIDLDSHMKWFTSILNNTSCLYFIYEQQGKAMGVLSFSQIDMKNKKASWAFYSGNTAVRGIGSEMEQLALDYAFNELNLNKLCCEVLEFNNSVINFHRKFGFKIEGIKKQDYCRDGFFYDIYQLAITKRDYLKTLKKYSVELPKMFTWEFSIDETKIDSFAELSGDKNSIHLDSKWAIEKGFENRIVHGALIVAEISKIAAMDYPSNGAVYLSQRVSFKKPVYPNTSLIGKAKLKTQLDKFVIISYEIYQNNDLVVDSESEFLLQGNI